MVMAVAVGGGIGWFLIENFKAKNVIVLGMQCMASFLVFYDIIGHLSSFNKTII